MQYFTRPLKKYVLILLTLAIFPLIHNKALASHQALAIDYLHGEGDLTGIRLAYRPYHMHITDIEWLGSVDVYWELSVNFWEFGDNNQHETNYALALSPVFSAQFATIANKYPLKWEFGIGVSLVEDTRFAGKDIGSHYQFEDRLGLIMQFGQSLGKSIAVRYMHYSNGGLNDKNPGMDFLNLSYAVNF